MNRHERRRQEKEVRQRANSRGVEAGSMVADPATADAFGAALALQQAGRLAEAERAWENLRTTLPNHDGVNVNLATVLWRLGRLDDAATACRRAIAGNPNLAEGYAMLGVILQAQGDNRGAVVNLERAVHLRDDLVTAWVQLANLHKQDGRVAAGRQTLRECALGVGRHGAGGRGRWHSRQALSRRHPLPPHTPRQ